jgi:hypothetical protein
VDHAFLMLALRLLLSQPTAAVDGLQPQDGPQNQLVSLPPFGTYLVAEFYKPVIRTCTLCTTYEYFGSTYSYPLATTRMPPLSYRIYAVYTMTVDYERTVSSVHLPSP